MFNDITDLMDVAHVGETSLNIIESGRLEWYRIEKDFILPITIGGHSKDCVRVPQATLSLMRNDIIGLCSCVQTCSEALYPTMRYSWDKDRCQRVNMCFYNSKLHPIGLNRDFFVRNPIIFTNVTTERNRNKKIDEIVN